MMIIRLLIVLVALPLTFYRCDQPAYAGDASAQNAETLKALRSVPKLLERNEKIRNGTEWDQMQNAYVKNRADYLAGDAEAALRLAQLFTLEARVTGEHGHYYPAALQIINETLNSDVDEPDVRFRLLTAKAGVQLSQHDFADALTTAQQAVAINNRNAAIYGVLADASVELGDYENAVRYADKMIQIRPDLRSYARVSYMREIHGKVDAAIEAMQLAADAGYPGMEDAAWARLELGQLYQRYGHPDKARLEFQRILSERPDYPFAIAALADLEMESGNLAKAESLLEEAANAIPEFGFYEQLAHIYKATDRTAKYQSTWDELMVMLQDDVDSGHNMNLEYAAIHTDLGDDPQTGLQYALREYEKRPANIDVNLQLAKIYAALNQVDLARKHLIDASVTQSEHPDLVALRKQLD